MSTDKGTVSRREIMAMATILSGVSIAAPLSAQGLGDIIGSARKGADAVTFSDDDLQSYFNQMSTEMDGQNPVAGANDPYGQRLAFLSQGLDSYDGLDLDIKAYLVSDVNAFAMANGTIRIFAGLMDEFTDDEIRYVIGHEIGHVKEEHTVKRMRGALQQDAALSIAGNADNRVKQLASSELGKLFGDVITAQHSQGDEREADDYAFEFMQDNGYDTQAWVTALEKLEAMSGGSSGPSWLATHPSPKSRARRMRRKLD